MNTSDREQLAAGTGRVLDLMLDHRWHTSAEIEEVCQVTAHSRLSDLRGAGCVIEKRSNHGATGRRKFSYRLIATGEQMAALDELEVGGAGAGVSLASSSSSDDRPAFPVGAREAETGQPGRDDVLAVPSGSFSDPHGLEDQGWRDLYAGDPVGEHVPPPVDTGGSQLQLGGVA